MYESVKVVQDCEIIFKRVLIFATELNFTEGASQSGHQHCRAGARGPR